GKYANGVHNGKTYKNGQEVSSLKNGYVNDLFYKNGELGNWWYDDGSDWYFFKDGKKLTGYGKDNSGEKYFVNGKYANWWYDDGSDWYFFKDGKKLIGYGRDASGEKYFVNGKYANGFYNGVNYKNGEIISKSSNNYIKYYSQNDPVWAYKVYGLGNMYNTGCVPTALAMIISTVKHNVSPQTIAEDLYKNTSHFNKKEPGTMAYGTGYILDKYGIRYRLVYSLEQLKSELSKGKIVYAAVGNQPFITNGYTHAIVLRGIDSNGNTTVYNPHSRMGSIRTFNTSKVWAHRSGEREDNQLGSPFIVIDA
ncbi:C39 family peptidase, partial [Gemelliphila palaticanis]